MAKHTVTDNIVAIKVIEKVQENMIDDLEIQNEIIKNIKSSEYSKNL